MHLEADRWINHLSGRLVADMRAHCRNVIAVRLDTEVFEALTNTGEIAMHLDADRLLVHLRDHIGAARGITARDLVQEINQAARAEICNERSLRHVIEELRLAGHHICGHPSDGYFIAASADELDRTCLFLHDRAMASLKQVAAMKRVSAPDLRGQLKLPT